MSKPRLPHPFCTPLKPIKISREQALSYHAQPRPGKIEVIPTKPFKGRRNLSMAYSPGVAYASEAIRDNVDEVYRLTGKGNLVAVISNGTAVLGLGNIGPLASKPVMEGKALLFKVFADIDCFDIEVDANDADSFVQAVKAIGPTFGGINLEDIKAPECFEIESRLRDALDIPVMHDDQHGTAIITAAGLLNALIVQKKEIGDVRVVVNGAGAAAMACTRMFMSLGVRKENVVMCDSHGVLNRKRFDSLNAQKKEFVTERDLDTLAEAMAGADVFLGLSVGDVVTADMLRSMADRPIVFALANPKPEIDYELARSTRDDVIIATGRSDLPNQINNVLGFPYIFRGALDSRASTINEAMKLAAVQAIASLAREPIPEYIVRASGKCELEFGREYIVPLPFDRRLLGIVAPAVARAAEESGVARRPIDDYEAYTAELKTLFEKDAEDINELLEPVRHVLYKRG